MSGVYPIRIDPVERVWSIIVIMDHLVKAQIFLKV